jgi:hypothetical protein
VNQSTDNDQPTGTTGDRSLAAWETEIRSILAGRRDYLLINLGSVAGYLSKLLSTSADVDTAETNLRQTVQNVVRAWHPQKLHPEYYTLIMLELIGAYQPMEGFVRIVGFLQRGHYFPSIDARAGAYGAGRDLHMKALTVLEYFYASAPPESGDDHAFESYVQVLEQHLQSELYCSYVVGRLIALNVLNTEDAKLGRPIEMNLRTIDEIVPILVGPSRQARLTEELSNIYTHCFLIGRIATERFQAALEDCGITSELDKDGVRLRLSVPGIRERVTLDVTEKFIITIFEQGSKRGREAAIMMSQQIDDE